MPETPDSRVRRSPPSREDAAAPSHDVRYAMRHVTTAWLFGAAWLYLTMGAALTRYAKLLGLPPFGFGILAALPFAGALTQLPSSYFMARYGRRKQVILIAGILSRVLWVLVALIPWVLPNAWWWPGLLLLRAMSSLSGHIMAPAVMSWFGDLVPRRIRGRYFSRRNQLGRLVGLVVTLAAGKVLDHYHAGSELVMLRTLSVMLTTGGVLGVIDFLWLARVPDVEHRANPEQRLWHLFREPLADRDFRHFLGYTATVTLGMGFISQFVWLYLFDVLLLNHTAANAMLVAIPLVVGYFAVPVWGRLQDRLGLKPTLVLAGIGIVPGAAWWILVTPDNLWMGYLGVLTAIAAWAGVELANFNILIGIGASRKGQRQGSAYLAVNSVVVAVAGALSGLFGGAVATMLQGWEGSILGFRLTYHGVLFLVSAALRLAGLFWLIGMREPEAHGTLAAVRYIAVNVHSNLRQGIFMPARRLVRIRALAYRLFGREEDDVA